MKNKRQQNANEIKFKTADGRNVENRLMATCEKLNGFNKIWYAEFC